MRHYVLSHPLKPGELFDIKAENLTDALTEFVRRLADLRLPAMQAIEYKLERTYSE
jgi:hypothetical protein